MNKLQDNIVQYLIEQRGESYPELTQDKGEYIINNDYLNYFIIFLKSMRYSDVSGIEINYERLDDELKLYKYYSSGKQKNRKLQMFAILSISLANENIKDIDREFERYCNRFHIAAEDLPELLYFSYLIKASQSFNDLDKINDEARKGFIGFSYKDSFGKNKKTDIISFEKKRIELLGKIIAGNYSGYPIIETYRNKIAGNKTYGVKDNAKVEIFVKGLLDYIVNIKKGRIKVMPYNLVENKLYNEKENTLVEHSNFGRCMIVKNIKNKEGKTIIVNTKLGCYRLEN
jgi:hypothetical protein